LRGFRAATTVCFAPARPGIGAGGAIGLQGGTSLAEPVGVRARRRDAAQGGRGSPCSSAARRQPRPPV